MLPWIQRTPVGLPFWLFEVDDWRREWLVVETEFRRQSIPTVPYNNIPVVKMPWIQCTVGRKNTDSVRAVLSRVQNNRTRFLWKCNDRGDSFDKPLRVESLGRWRGPAALCRCFCYCRYIVLLPFLTYSRTRRRRRRRGGVRFKGRPVWSFIIKNPTTVTSGVVQCDRTRTGPGGGTAARRSVNSKFRVKNPRPSEQTENDRGRRATLPDRRRC